MSKSTNTNILLNTPALIKLRGQLGEVEQLMRRGIQCDEDTGREYFTGYAYKTLYDWDQYFEAIIQIYMGWPSTYIRNAITIFLDHQQESGHIARSVPSNEWHDPEHVKPFLAQTAMLVERYYEDDLGWLLNEHYYPRLVKYLYYWLEQMDSTGNGLAEWMSAPHTGMDNHHERAGHWLARISKGVDLNCYLYRECQAVAHLAEKYGNKGQSAELHAHAAQLAERIRRLMWNEEDGFFYDLHTQTGEKIPVKTIAGLLPLWSKIATPEQARRLVYDHLFNSDEFWTAWPIPAFARNDPGYSLTPFPTDVIYPNTCSWRGNTWIPTNYMVYHGLRNYGYHQLASLLADKTWKLVQRAGNCEYYQSEAGEGRGLNPFWGWSLLAHFLPYEVELEKVTV